MGNFTDALIQAGRELLCTSATLGDRLSKNIPFLGATDRLTRAYMLRQWMARAGCDQELPTPVLPPLEAQCPVRYELQVTFRGVSEVTGQPISGFFQQVLWGPLSNFRVVTPSPTFTPNGSSYFVVCRGDGASPLPNGATLDKRCGDRPENGLTWTLDYVRRLDGQPDNCGDPDPEPDEYDPDDFTYPININYVDNGGTNITLPVVGVVGLMYIDADLNVNIPVSFTFNPNFNFNPTFNYKVDVNFPIDGSPPTITNPRPPNDDPPRTDPPKGDKPDDYAPTTPPPPAPPETPDPPPPEDEEDPKSVIRGVLVTVTNIDPSAKASIIGQDANPDIYVPRLGTIQFQVRLANGSGGWTSDIPVKNKRNLIPCPWEGGAIAVVGTPELGVTWTVTPIYAKLDDSFV